MKGYISPKILSPYFRCDRIPRKTKKRLKKKYPKVFEMDFLDINQKLWYIQSMEKPKLNKFLISEMLKV